MSDPTAFPAQTLRAELAATLRLSGPLALANILQMLTYAIDVMFIARLGETELAASALAVALYGIVVWSLVALTGAVAPVMAATLGELGEGNRRAIRPVRRAVRMALWLCVITGLPGMALCLAVGPIANATGQPPRLAAMAAQYMAILAFSLIPMLVAAVLRNYVSTLDRAMTGTIITAMGIGVNALANYALIFGNLGAPRLELAGAAIATFITSVAIVSAYLLAIRFDPRLAFYRIFGGFFRPDWARLAELVRIGTPIGLMTLAEAGVFSAAVFLMGRLGQLEVAAHTIALQIAALAFMVPMGIGQAATIRVGLAFGARDPDGIARAGQAALLVAMGFMAFTASLILAAPRLLLGIYIDVSDPANAALVAMALTLLQVAAAFQLADGLQVVAAGLLRGLKDTAVPMWIAIFSYWLPGFGVAAGLGLVASWGAVGVWTGLACGLFSAASLLGWRWRRRGPLGLVEAEPRPAA